MQRKQKTPAKPRKPRGKNYALALIDGAALDEIVSLVAEAKGMRESDLWRVIVESIEAARDFSPARFARACGESSPLPEK